MSSSGVEQLAGWFGRRQRWAVISGAGCSTASGIPDYRDREGAWKRRPPVQIRDFLASEAARRRYWARSLAGWPQFAAAEPNAAHRALARLERAGRVVHLVTQNVDGLHQKAGSRRVTDLHGRLDGVECLGCGAETPRADFQLRLQAGNAGWVMPPAPSAPDGDADLDGVDFSAFRVPACECCGGVLKPAVVFFGDAIPAARSRVALAVVQEADALLVVGSSLMVWSGYRLVRAAAEAGLPVVAVNLGRTRADELMSFKLDAACDTALDALAETLAA
ncbi:MAG TPA: NAD-dependent protein deacetylase [Gammaproteobacteria bacterium]|nr:NAD-dependent protein deacetylase [Gammaproteobacteria bacterium]